MTTQNQSTACREKACCADGDSNPSFEPFTSPTFEANKCFREMKVSCTSEASSLTVEQWSNKECSGKAIQGYTLAPKKCYSDRDMGTFVMPWLEAPCPTWFKKTFLGKSSGDFADHGELCVELRSLKCKAALKANGPQYLEEWTREACPAGKPGCNADVLHEELIKQHSYTLADACKKSPREPPEAHALRRKLRILKGGVPCNSACILAK